MTGLPPPVHMDLTSCLATDTQQYRDTNRPVRPQRRPESETFSVREHCGGKGSHISVEAERHVIVSELSVNI